MDSSSEGSFVWTDASNDTIDSGVKINGKMTKTHSEDESVSGKSYKKQLQEELFAQSDRSMEDEGQHKLKKRKRKVTEEQSGSEHASPKKKKIKREPESDIDGSASKLKTNGHNLNESHDSYDESYLDLKVKAEQLFAAPLVKTKKKKKKSKRRHDSINGETNHDESLLEEEEMAEGGNDGSPTQYAEDPETTDNTQVVTVVEDTKVNNKKPSTRDSDECRERGKQQLDPPADTNVSFNTPTIKSVSRSSKISERIQFEEDEGSEMETSQLHSNKPSNKSSKLKTFLKNNTNLKPLTSKLKTESVLTADDEIWIIKCPKDVNIDAFQNKDLMLEGKCKLKLNGQTYEGIMDDVSGNMSILSSEKSDFVIKSLSVKGCLNLRKRIPKSLILDGSIVSNQIFIPLPETKCRHPLFGSNYRKAIKLPASVAERLRTNTTSVPVTPERANKKRQSKEISMLQHDDFLSTPKPEPSLESSVKPEEETDQPVVSRKKKKKRKHSEPEEIAPKQKKRKKHDLESAEAWESEQAIEENLFNF